MSSKRKTVVLRRCVDGDGTRYLEATFNDSGDLVIEGQDLGQGVEQVFGPGIREYEWIWTIRRGDLPKLKALLGGDLLAGLKKDYSGSGAAKLHTFLTDSKVPFEAYSRVGE